MNKLISIIIIGLITATLSGCNSMPKHIKDTLPEERSVVFGWMDVSDTVFGSGWTNMYVTQAVPKDLKEPTFGTYGLKPIKKEDKYIYWTTIATNGALVNSHVKVDLGTIIYTFSYDDGRGGYVKIDKPGVYFIGAKRIVDKSEKGFFSSMKLSIEDAPDAPDQIEIIEAIMDSKLVKDMEPAAVKQLEDYLAQLKK